jgi:hypothetical protein
VNQDGAELSQMTATLDGGGMRPLPKGSTVAVEGLPPGWYQLRPNTKGLERRPIAVRIEPGVQKDLGDIVLQPEVWISGRISPFEKSKSRVGFRCEVYDPADYGVIRGSIQMSPPSDDGSFRIGGLSRGLYLLKWTDRESRSGAWARVVDTRAGPVENLSVELVEGVPLVLNASSEDWTSTRFRVLNENGTPILTGRLRNDMPQSFKLAPADYRIEVQQELGNPIQRAVRIGKEPVEMTFP